MHNLARIVAISVTSICLTGCLVYKESTGNAEKPTGDETETETETETESNVVLADPNNIQISNQLENDGLIAPVAPTLSILAAPGALRFVWKDKHNEETTELTKIALYQYDYRSDIETQIDATIETTDTQYTQTIGPHQLAWDSTSYRIELCTSDNCLSSMRMPIKDLLSNAVTPITPDNTQLSNSFGDHVALNATGNVAVITSPAQASAVVLFHVADRWIQASTLTSNQFATQTGATMRAALSASGDTIAIASIANNTKPNVVVFDRLGENWLESSSMLLNTSNTLAQNWYTDSLVIDLSDDGDRVAVAAHSVVSANNALNSGNNNVMIFDRGTTSWVNSATLSIPAQHTRLPAFSTSADIDRVFILSALTGSLYLNEYALSANSWGNTKPQFIGAISPTADNIVVSGSNATEIAIAGWEASSSSGRAPVVWRFQKLAGSWIASDSVKLPTTTAATASLRLAADSQLSSIAIGWQAANSANVAFYGQTPLGWQHYFSVPDAFNLNRNLALAQSVAISADNSTAFIGTSNTGNGGMVSAFR